MAWEDFPGSVILRDVDAVPCCAVDGNVPINVCWQWKMSGYQQATWYHVGTQVPRL